MTTTQTTTDTQQEDFSLPSFGYSKVAHRVSSNPGDALLD